MKQQNRFFTDQEGTSVFLHQWLPDGEPKAILQLVHGMAEHAGRYERLARFLNDRGIAVFADDHTGHGLSVADGKSWGVLAEKNGFGKMVENEKAITKEIRRLYPHAPVFLFGHSMGSFIARHFIARYGKTVDGLILSGTGDPSCLGLLGGFIFATFQSLLFGQKDPAKFLDKLVFGGYNRTFAPNRTAFDWLSREEKEVDKYIQDPMCGHVFPAGFYVQFFRALLFLKRKKSVFRIPRNLPVFLFSGEKDPVGNDGKGVMTLYETYRRHGIENLRLQLFPDGRHEMLNEINREEVMEVLYHWIQGNV
ncbi:MAG: alpha/beta hydrolase [Bacteroidales bacterium]|nr:alpha/beta hydrolase [Bacteroidales bacterium]